MNRYMTWVSVLLVAGLLVSCGGGGGDDSTGGGGSPGTPGTPGSPGTPGTPGTPNGGNNSGGSVGTFPSAGARVEESDAAVSLSGEWTQSNPKFGWSGGAARQSTVAGAVASFTFTGTSVTWIGSRSERGGIALVKVDGGAAKEVDLFARPNEIRTPVLTINGLSAGTHTLTIEVTGRQNQGATSNVVVVDAFDVQAPIVSHLQETDPDAVFSAGWVQDPSSAWSGGGVATLPDPPRGGAKVTETAGAKVTLTFRGTSISWSGYRGPDAGIARVQVDGGAASEVDTYSPTQKFQEMVFTETGLADASHTLTIEATGRKNDASTGAQIVVDAFDVTTPGRRYQEEDPAITYTGKWIHGNINRSWSEGASATTVTPGSRATFSFTGTSVSWIGAQKESAGGRAKIYLDGVLVKEVNNWKPVPIEGYQRTIYRVDGLTNGPHTLTIEALSSDSYIVVDAFDVHP
jgi:hypothetical protein